MLRTTVALVLLLGSTPLAVASPSEELTALGGLLASSDPSHAFQFSNGPKIIRSPRRFGKVSMETETEQDTPKVEAVAEEEAEAATEAAAAPAVAAPAAAAAAAAQEVDPYSEEVDPYKKRKVKKQKVFDIKEWAGVSEPLGFFDPLGFSNDAPETKMRFYRECELKHGRLAMLASVGFLVAEKFHPLWGGNINVPSAFAFEKTGLYTSGVWTVSVAQIAAYELISQVDKFISPFGDEGRPWEMKLGYPVGDGGFDPLGLQRFQTPEEMKVMRTKELNNGRVAMIAIAGMVAQELATGKQLLWTPLD
jgi:hypothetical protein